MASHGCAVIHATIWCAFTVTVLSAPREFRGVIRFQ